MADWSKTWTFFEGEWHEGNVPLWGVRTHAIWLGSSVFDGARVFEGVAPDLDLHCARVNASAKTMFLDPVVPVERWIELVNEGRKRFDPDTPLYVRPMYWAERAGPLALPPDPASTRWCLSLYETPMRKPDGFSITLSPFRRPTLETAPVDAKAGCLYPHNARAMFEAKSRGFDNCIVCDAAGNVEPGNALRCGGRRSIHLRCPAPTRGKKQIRSTTALREARHDPEHPRSPRRHAPQGAQIRRRRLGAAACAQGHHGTNGLGRVRLRDGASGDKCAGDDKTDRQRARAWQGPTPGAQTGGS